MGRIRVIMVLLVFESLNLMVTGQVAGQSGGREIVREFMPVSLDNAPVPTAFVNADLGHVSRALKYWNVL